MKKILVLLTIMVLAVSSVWAAEIAMVTVDMEKVFTTYEKTKEENQKLQEAQKGKELEGQAKLNNINKLKEEAMLLTDEAREKKDNEIREKIGELQKFGEDSRRELLQQRDLLWNQIVDKIKEVISLEAKAKKYTLVFDDKALFYKAESVKDITEDITTIMNASYKKESQQ